MFGLINSKKNVKPVKYKNYGHSDLPKPEPRYYFYRRNYRIAINFVVILCAINISLMGYAYYLYASKNTQKYYATTYDGKLIEIKPYKIID